MARSALYVFVALASALNVAAQTTTPPQSASSPLPTFPTTPLVDLNFTWGNLPNQAVPGDYVRGTQTGTNLCNSTTQNQESECQTLVVNNIFDFAFYGPPQPNSTISDTEGIEVVFSTNNTHGTRMIPNGTIIGLQWLNTPDYQQVVALINQDYLNINAQDYGGELDGGGQDENGNPMGALVYSNAFTGSMVQVHNWVQFIGSNVSAVKICNPDGSNPAGFCQHTLDRIGIPYNVPNNAQLGVFEMCDSDPMTIPGEYVVNGQTSSYAQPPESLGAITTVPYSPEVPSSSNCQTYQSTDLFKDMLTVTPAGISVPTSSPTQTGSGSGASGSRTNTGSPATSTSKGNGASGVTISLFSSILGVAFSVGFLA
jgi:hypothetical protein